MRVPVPRLDRRPSRSALLLALLLVAGGTACNGGLAALVGAMQNDPSNASPTLGGFSVTGSRVSPATIRLVAQDREGDPVDLRFFYSTPGQPVRPLAGLSGGNPVRLATTEAGVLHVLEWNFALEPGLDPSTYVPGVSVYAEPVGGAGSVLIDGQNAALDVAFGNDPPQVVDASASADEVSGIALLQFVVQDSASDPVDVVVEYDVIGDQPDAGWRLTRPAGLTTTPTVSMTQIPTSPTGVVVSYFWDTLADFPNGDLPVRVRITAADPYVTGSPALTMVFQVDNNEPPNVLFSEFAMQASTDRFRGLAIGGQVFDNEGDRVRLVAQYRRANEPFPVLPNNVAALLAAMADPVQRANLQICTPMPYRADGELDPLGPSSVRVRDFHARLGTLPVDHFPGAVLDVLRHPYAFGDVAPTLSGSGPASPVDAATTADGTGLVVLEATGANGWRLRRFVLPGAGSGARTLVLASGNGTPIALSRFVESWIVAADNGAAWELFSIDGNGATVATAQGTGVLRGIVAENARMVYATVDDTVVRVGMPDTGTEIAVLVQGLDQPWGVAHAPFLHGRLIVAEHGRDRLLEVDVVGRYAREFLAADRSGGAAFPAPRAVQVLQGETLVVAVCEPSPGQGELRARAVGRALPDGQGGRGPFVELWRPCSPTARIARGPEGVSILTEGGVVGIAGGIEQRLTVSHAEPGRETLHVSEPLSGAVTGPRRFRLTTPDPGRIAPPTGAFSSTVWDTAADQAGPLPFVDGQEIFLRLTPFDADLGFPSESVFPIVLEHPGGHRGEDLSWNGTPAMGDIDGDGALDILIHNGATSRVAYQKMPGKFESSSETYVLDAGGPMFSVLTKGEIVDHGQALPIDADEDGRLDFVTAGPAGLQILFGRGDGTLESRATVFPSLPGTGWALRVTPVDLDGDGQLEFVTAHWMLDWPANPAGGQAVVVWRRTDPRVWTPEPPLWLDQIGITPLFNAPTLILPMDVDGDGDLDLLVAALQHGGSHYPASALGWFEQTAPLTFHPEPYLLRDYSVLPWSGGQFVSLHAADLDEDGREDLLATSSVDDSVMGPDLGYGKANLQRRLGPAEFEWDADRFGSTATGLDAFLSLSRGAELLRLDDDDRCDLVVMHSPFYYPTSLRDGSSPLGGTRTRSAPQYVFPDSIRFPTAVGDLDADGVVDYLVTGGLDLSSRPGFARAKAVHRVTAGQSGLQFSTGSTFIDWHLPTEWSWRWVVGDLDQDGDLDLVGLRAGGGLEFSPGGTIQGRDAHVVLYEQAEPRKIVGRQVIKTQQLAATLDALIEDLDGDGAVELVVVSWNGFPQWPHYPEVTGGKITIHRRVGRFEFEDPASIELICSGVPGAIEAADIDGDGDMDLIVTLVRGLALWIQDAPGVFREVLVAPGAAGPGVSVAATALEVVDMDGDGLLDIVTGQYATDPSQSIDSLPPLTVYYQVGPESFEIVPVGTPGGARAWNIRTADLDGDGRRDIVWVDRLGRNVRVMMQKEPRVFTETFALAVNPGQNSTSEWVVGGLELVDLDGDGDLDILINNSQLGTHVLVQYAPGRFAHHAQLTNFFSQSSIVATDLDADGQLEILTRTGLMWGGAR